MLATASSRVRHDDHVVGRPAGPADRRACPSNLGPILTYGIATAILSAGIIVLVTMVALWRRSDPIPTPVPAGATLSPDGYYWWDGGAWRPVR